MNTVSEACPRPFHRRTLALLAVLLGVLALPLFSANAQATVYPPGSIWDGYSKSFYSYSWLGTGAPYDNRGDYVVGIQRELRYISQVIDISPPGSSNDGIFGTGTKQSVMDFQDSQGLSADGVVGGQTWWSLWSWLRWDYDSSGYEYYYVLNTYFTDFWRFQINNWHWEIRNKNNTGWCSFTVNGPS